jgi:hypothetical protein
MSHHSSHNWLMRTLEVSRNILKSNKIYTPGKKVFNRIECHIIPAIFG